MSFWQSELLGLVWSLQRLIQGFLKKALKIYITHMFSGVRRDFYRALLYLLVFKNNFIYFQKNKFNEYCLHKFLFGKDCLYSGYIYKNFKTVTCCLLLPGWPQVPIVNQNSVMLNLVVTPFVRHFLTKFGANLKKKYLCFIWYPLR